MGREVGESSGNIMHSHPCWDWHQQSCRQNRSRSEQGRYLDRRGTAFLRLLKDLREGAQHVEERYRKGCGRFLRLRDLAFWLLQGRLVSHDVQTVRPDRANTDSRLRGLPCRRNAFNSQFTGDPDEQGG